MPRTAVAKVHKGKGKGWGSGKGKAVSKKVVEWEHDDSETEEHLVDGHAAGLRPRGEESDDSTSSDDADQKQEGGRDVKAAAGMGDVMTRILGQKLDGGSHAPVLAKRKTRAMREMEEEKGRILEHRGKAVAKRACLTQQNVVPDHTTVDQERQLKKIATRGVVALFNAISKQQQEDANGTEGPQKRGKAAGEVGASAKAAVKSVSKGAFLDMLKSATAPAGTQPVGDGSDNRGQDGGEASAWSVLQDDYMLGTRTMKDWDNQSDDSEARDLGDLSSDDDIQ